jgi:hypothetical protein
MAEECGRHSKLELLLALAERLDQVLWCHRYRSRL